ncbi:hypothetical protein AAG565_10605 [Fontimonas sp. SYSU GA230001]|uniref:hypothetical protein n=1 Tax=Fontimonas sp. SYSU GA230001 TaxID=3142450 RepID=UPI0032B49D9B
MSYRPLGRALVAGVWLVLGAAAHAGEIVCWTDDSGRRACGDRVPPEYAKRERQVYDKTGRMVDVLPRQRTPEEIAEAERQAAEEKASRQRAVDQAAYDRFLLQTYSGVGELIRARDERLKLLDTRLKLAEKSLADNELGIQQLEEQIADAERDDKAVPERLSKQLKESQRTLSGNRRAVDKLRKERAELVAKYDSDIARYRELTAPPPPPSPEPEAAAPP